MAQAADQHPVQLPQITVIEQPADHVRRDHLGADRVELVPGQELQPTIGARQRNLETSVQGTVGLDLDLA
jgi:hypothetical protein